MPERLSPLDVSFLYMEEQTTPMHVGTLALFDGDDAFDLEHLTGLIERRIARVPRYRQRVRPVPGRLANPVWVDDPHFDVNYHVRQSVLPRPGTDAQLRELVGRVMSRPLDRNRPLWEMYLVEGMEENRFAILSKTHQALVDGVTTVEIGQVILDAEAADPVGEPEPESWHAGPEPTWLDLVGDAAAGAVRRPSMVADTVRSAVGDMRSVAERAWDAASGVFAVATTAVRPAPPSPLNGVIGSHRRYATASTDLEDYRRIRDSREMRRESTVNDVVLAVVAGALREWLLMRGEPVAPQTTVRALVPVSVREDEQTGQTKNAITTYLVDLPVGENNPLMRLHQVTYAMRAHKESGQAVGANTLIALSGFSPTTLHSVAARTASGLSRRLFNLVVTNVPGPQVPLYAGESRMLEAYPVVPLAKGQAVSIGLTSYDGNVYFGLNADRDLLPDVDLLADCLVDSLTELVETVK
ncbi:MAG: wax ester/triacylglycerol synthase family O-acyltransferase [Streptosporangiales bacterium]|nr:wax ester/triacylglycerol synthase family O-acyltransferase [Streptosporangiales bacterium]